MKIYTLMMAPVNPPYDDAAKNIALGISQRIKTQEFYFFSSWKNRPFPESINITFIPSIFQRAGAHSMPLAQKIFVTLVIIFNMRSIGLLQFFFNPQPYFSRIFGWLTRFTNKKSLQIITSSHSLFSKNKPGKIARLFFADQVVVMSEYAQKKLEGEGVKNITCIYPGIELSRFTPASSNIQPAGQMNIIYPGTYKLLNESFSFDDFCGIAKEISKRFKQARFIMACRIRSRQEAILSRKFRKQVGGHDLERLFTFFDTVGDIPSLFNSSHIGIIPAYRELAGILEIPLVLLELAALEKPVLYPALPPLNELEARGIGVAVTDLSAGGYANALSMLLDDPEQYSRIGKKSRRGVIEHFNMESVAAEFQKIYHNLENRA